MIGLRPILSESQPNRMKNGVPMASGLLAEEDGEDGEGGEVDQVLGMVDAEAVDRRKEEERRGGDGKGHRQ